MNKLQVTLACLLVSLAAGCTTQPPTTLQAEPGAVGTLVIREDAILGIANHGSGKGTLAVFGWQYDFELSNMSISGVGMGAVQLEGNVFNISAVEDFEGTYQAASSAGSTDGFWFENEKGVRVHVRAVGQKVQIRQTGGTVVTLK